MSVNNFKKDFPIFENKDIAYLDSGATTQKPTSVLEAIEKFYKNENANPHRGAYGLSIEATEIYENTRDKIAKFINAKHREEIIFSKNASESLNLIAYSYGLDNLKKDDEIVLSIMEHHSNLVPWQMVAKKTESKLNYMYINDNFEISDEEIETKITDKTKIVGITHVSNVLGTINNIEKIIKYAHKKGAIVVVDGSQSIPHMEIDVQKLDADFFVFSGHKMLAPLGIGILYGKREILNKMNPFLMGGDMIEYVYEQETTFAPLPNKFEAGTQNVEGVIGLGAAIDYIKNIGYNKIQEIEKEVTSYARQELSKLEYLTLYLTPNEEKHSSVISFNIKGVHPHDVASILDSENVCVRSGNHCAQPLLRSMGIDSTCRASFYIYNTKEDVDKLVIALNKAYNMFKKYINN
ncbi:MAG TPA: cysteine desulfurase [Clostridiaceae bacterium]|jgi:cysteine desulfurases, SufS subfamily|nr:cysteine desulfurase [Clostridia bacterium]CDC06340.1 cysteine desulfurase SufS subfamily [Clostridium sp. CAG:343]HCF34573.1 cysteine desulfurase [Clostridiales bacterium]HJJ18764.1 cysteine desulfurase [Clostridiaceae bacterium]MBP8633959.1 cysteine desulfurase [Clostridia bacterium]